MVFYQSFPRNGRTFADWAKFSALQSCRRRGATRDHETSRNPHPRRTLHHAFDAKAAALRATTNPGAAKDRRCRSGGDLPPPGLRLRLAGVGTSPPPFRASSPRRDTNAAFTAHEISRKVRTGHLLTFPPSHLPFVKPAKRAFSCAAKAAFRVRRQDETRRVATEISRRPRQSLEADRGIDGANRRQAIRPAAGFVVARSATPSTKFFEAPKMRR